MTLIPFNGRQQTQTNAFSADIGNELWMILMSGFSLRCSIHRHFEKTFLSSLFLEVSGNEFKLKN